MRLGITDSTTMPVSAAGSTAGSVGHGRRKITAQDALEIYLAQVHRQPSTSSRLAERYGITSKAVRDIW
jgi:hypothetical protein